MAAVRDRNGVGSTNSARTLESTTTSFYGPGLPSSLICLIVASISISQPRVVADEAGALCFTIGFAGLITPERFLPLEGSARSSVLQSPEPRRNELVRKLRTTNPTITNRAHPVRWPLNAREPYGELAMIQTAEGWRKPGRLFSRESTAPPPDLVLLTIRIRVGWLR
jgi:hypothetical protein